MARNHFGGGEPRVHNLAGRPVAKKRFEGRLENSNSRVKFSSLTIRPGRFVIWWPTRPSPRCRTLKRASVLNVRFPLFCERYGGGSQWHDGVIVNRAAATQPRAVAVPPSDGREGRLFQTRARAGSKRVRFPDKRTGFDCFPRRNDFWRSVRRVRESGPAWSRCNLRSRLSPLRLLSPPHTATTLTNSPSRAHSVRLGGGCRCNTRQH